MVKIVKNNDIVPKKAKNKKENIKLLKKSNKKLLKSKHVVVQKPKKIKLKKIEPPENNSDSEIEEFLEEEDSDNEEMLIEELENSDSEEEGEDEELDDEALMEKHKKDLDKLKDTDPEFYKFLQENDKKLLNFNVSDDEEDLANEQESEEEKIHQPDHDLEIASDESDFEADEQEDAQEDDKVITLKLLKTWQNEIQTDKSNKTIIKIVQAFHAALRRISSDGEPQDDEPEMFKVDGSAVFNGVIQLCVIHLGSAIRRYLGLQHGSKQPPHKSKKFNKIKGVLKGYFTDLAKLLLGITSSNIQTVLLKHLHYMSPMLNSYTNITKSILNKLIKIWGSAEDSVRVLAFFCILRIVNNQMSSTLNITLKSMYMTYVKNSKFVSISALASINFMKRSLVEMFALDLNVSYPHVFLYIRQLAIHLRNAITVNKKENVQAVYNWQFVNSLRLWGMLLGMTQNKPQIQQLVYPFIQVCLGTIKLVPTAQYYPLRFHIVQILIDFTKETGVFIPILPFLLEVLTGYDFNKKHQKVSMKPVHFTCILRLSKSQLQENGFKDSVIDTIYSQLLEYLSLMSSSISFPDLSLLCILQIKQFMKKCKMANYNRKFKQLLEKIEQNSRFIEMQRSKLSLKLTDLKQIEGWEAQIKTKETPLTKYFNSWTVIRNMKKSKEITNNDELADYKLPVLKKKVKKNAENNDNNGPVELFPSDSEDEEENENKKRKRGKRGGKNVKKLHTKIPAHQSEDMDIVGEDIVKDITADDW